MQEFKHHFVDVTHYAGFCLYFAVSWRSLTAAIVWQFAWNPTFLSHCFIPSHFKRSQVATQFLRNPLMKLGSSYSPAFYKYYMHDTFPLNSLIYQRRVFLSQRLLSRFPLRTQVSEVTIVMPSLHFLQANSFMHNLPTLKRVWIIKVTHKWWRFVNNYLIPLFPLLWR